MGQNRTHNNIEVNRMLVFHNAMSVSDRNFVRVHLN